MNWGKKEMHERKRSYSCLLLHSTTFYIFASGGGWSWEGRFCTNVAQIFTRIYSPPCLDKKIFQRSRWMRCNIFNDGMVEPPVDWINSPKGEGPLRILRCKGDGPSLLPTSRGTNESFKRDNPLAFNRSTLVSFPILRIFFLKVERIDLNLRFVNFWNDREDLKLKTDFLQKRLN